MKVDGCMMTITCIYIPLDTFMYSFFTRSPYTNIVSIMLYNYILVETKISDTTSIYNLHTLDIQISFYVMFKKCWGFFGEQEV